MIEIKMVGDWALTKRLLSNIDKNLRAASIRAQRKTAEKYVRLVKSHLRNQDIPGWTPLSDKYADWKMGKYGHEDMLMLTHVMYDSIDSWRSSNIYYAGIKMGINYPSGMSVSRVAYIHEAWATGRGDKPKRPLWGYTWKKDMGGNKQVREEFIDEIKHRMRSQGYPIKRNAF
jgi:hypothetical protein